MTPKTISIKVTADLGVSTGKFFYDTPETKGFISLLPMLSECSKAEYVEGVHRDKGTNYIRWDDRYWIAGANASQTPHKTISTERKIQTAGVRLASAIGMVAREYPDTELNLELRLLLPLDEMGDADALKTHIMENIYALGCEGKWVDTTVKSISIYPEGRGLLTWAKEDPSCILIFGHRDLTLLWVEDGAIVHGKSHTFAGWGFLNFLNRCGHTFKQELEAARYVFLAGPELNDEPLLKLVSSETELSELKQKLMETRAILGRAIAQKLSTLGISKCHQVLVSGGSSLFWKNELDQLHTKVDFCAAQRKKLMADYGMKKTPMVFRALDGYGVHTLEGLVNV